eukprot:scaffold3762_cov118-Isochrysis_galbana.AAC.14
MCNACMNANFKGQLYAITTPTPAVFEVHADACGRTYVCVSCCTHIARATLARPQRLAACACAVRGIAAAVKRCAVTATPAVAGLLLKRSALNSPAGDANGASSVSLLGGGSSGALTMASPAAASNEGVTTDHGEHRASS